MNTTEKKVKEQFKYYIFLSVTYAILIVTAQAMAYRFISLGGFIEPGGIFIFPATFAVGDVIAEVYGPTLARRSIFVALFAQAFFSIIPMLINTMPSPSYWHHQEAYHVVFGSSWLVFISNLVALMIGMVLNTQIIGKTKLLAKGRFFTLRSLFSSAIGEFILTLIIVAIAIVPVNGFIRSIDIFYNMFIFKLLFSALAAYPASLLVVIFKKLDKVDVYEENVSINPLSCIVHREKTTSSSNVIDFSDLQKK